MIVKLYKNQSSDNTINKVLLNEMELNFNLRADFNLISPTLILNGLGIENYNYLVIDEINRKYILNNVRPLGGGLYEFNFIIDVLETYYDDFKNLECLFYRNIKSTDNYQAVLETNNVSVNSELLSNVVLEPSNENVLITIGKQND